jgi:molybdopterin converting factor small subunit
MVITIRAHGSLRERIPDNTTLENARTVGDAVERLDVPSESGLAILVNDHLADWNTLLHDGDIVQLVPQLSGG